ncbi:MAG: penicillin-binding protein 1C [Ignavibacteriae bacterium]|nr:penicillin-binding protein 1C [Ignavibacteriota bacterium]
MRNRVVTTALTSLRAIELSEGLARIILGLAFLSVLFVGSLFIPLDMDRFDSSLVTSVRIYDRHGVLLREILSDEEGRGSWRPIKEISPHLLNAFIASEDTRFRRHAGIDPLAISRAIVQNVRAGRLVAGGSTITQQVIRNVYHHPRTLIYKVLEAWCALRLERLVTKDDILLQYVNRIPFGNQVFGIEAAAQLYFGKPARQLSLAESAFLAAIPNSPTVNDPYRRFDRVRQRQQYVLGRMMQERYISGDEMEDAVQEPLVLVPAESQFRAPHFTQMVVERIPWEPRPSEIHTTLDYHIHKSAQSLLQAHLIRLKRHKITNGAIVVIDNRSSEIVALVGSRNFFDPHTDGQVNGALALRQPGSTLKPFMYGLALEFGLTASDLLPDIPRRTMTEQTDFVPENYDRKYHGPVRLRNALACSYNVPAVRVAERLGEEALLQKLHIVGFESLQKPASFYGVGLTLGNGEVTLVELANAYASIARGGMFQAVKSVVKVLDAEQRVLNLPPLEAERPVFSPQVTFLLTDILSDPQARAPSFGANSSLNLPFPCAAKTGTSKDYKDNWTVGYTPSYTVAVWVGNFNGDPMKGVSGITGAAPLFRDLMLLLHQGKPVEDFTVPPGVTTATICPRSGMAPGEYCPGVAREYFVNGSEPRERCSIHRQYRLDRRNVFLASSNTPEEFVEVRVFEVFPPMYDAWVEAAGIPKPPPTTSLVTIRPDVVGSTERFYHREAPLAISYPSPGDVFKIDPILRLEYQTITVESIVSPGVEKVLLVVNEKETSALQKPYRHRLSIGSFQKGNHVLKLKGIRGSRRVESVPVHITIN